jgi:hypothetical protein
MDKHLGGFFDHSQIQTPSEATTILSKKNKIIFLMNTLKTKILEKGNPKTGNEIENRKLNENYGVKYGDC